MFIQAFLRIFILALLITSTAIQAVETAPYAGQHTRSIKSLSADDIHSLKTGQGWGLAKPAELNGVPGPAHILELRDELKLSNQQIISIQRLWETMNQSARQYGDLYLQSEAKIEAFFNTPDADETLLPELLSESANHLAKLRYVHLQTHLKTKPLLTEHQTILYQQLRGYTEGSHLEGNKHNH